MQACGRTPTRSWTHPGALSSQPTQACTESCRVGSAECLACFKESRCRHGFGEGMANHGGRRHDTPMTDPLPVMSSFLSVCSSIVVFLSAGPGPRGGNVTNTV